MNDEYTCAVCGETYLKGQSDDDALDELEANFPGFDAHDDCALVCDDCYKAMMSTPIDGTAFIGDLIRVRDRVRGRADYPSNVTIAGFTRYLDHITGCYTPPNEPVTSACKRWNEALDHCKPDCK